MWVLRSIHTEPSNIINSSKSPQVSEEVVLPIENVYIVYNAFINLKRSNWADLIQQQVANLVSNGLIEKTKELHVCLSIDAESVDESITESSVNKISSIIYSIVPKSKAMISVTYKNLFEYPGNHKVWEIGQRIENKVDADKSVILYFHSKGMFNGHLKNNPRSTREILLFQTVIDPWEYVLQRLSANPLINKAGFAASEYGYIWYNFWWARASYIQKLEEPELTKDRYYYERWLGRVKPEHIWPGSSPQFIALALSKNDSRGAFQSSGDCLSLCRPDVPVGVYFTIPHPCEHAGLNFRQQLSKLYHIFFA